MPTKLQLVDKVLGRVSRFAKFVGNTRPQVTIGLLNRKEGGIKAALAPGGKIQAPVKGGNKSYPQIVPHTNSIEVSD